MNHQYFFVLLKTSMSLVILTLLAISLTISFSALIYTGPLDQHLGKGIGLALLGTVSMSIIAALTASYRGTICHAQDLPAILLAGPAAAIGGALADTSPDLAFATVATLIGFATVVTGLALFAAGHFRFGALARFLPYSVVGGFLAATGYLLTTGALSLMVKGNVTAWTLGVLFQEGAALKWMPWILFSALCVVTARKAKFDLALPLFLFSGAIVFYVVLWILGIDLVTATEMGLLLGPFEGSNFLDGVSLEVPLTARWDLILGQAPSILAVVAMSTLGLLLNASGLEVEIGRDLNFERDLQSVGAANVAAGLTGGFAGFHLLGETLFAAKMGVVGISAGISVAVAAVLTLYFGTSLVALVPVGLVASVIAFLGLDLLWTWLWEQNRRFPAGDKFILTLIVVVAATFGFLESLSFGMLAAALLFILTYARIDVVRLRASGAVRRSSVERGPAEMAVLSKQAKSVEILELGGFLFFGTANGILSTLKPIFENESPPTCVVFELSKVTGIDTSAVFVFSRIATFCQQKGARFIVCGATTDIEARLAKIGAETFETLDTALKAIETEILVDADQKSHLVSESILDSLRTAYPELDTASFSKIIDLEAGDVLVSEGADSKAIYQILEGELRAEVEGEDGKSIIVSHFLSGALIGEIAFYAEVPRTAAIIAETAARVQVINLDAIPDTYDGRTAAASIHRIAAGYLAKRLIRMTSLFKSAGL